MTTNEKIRLAEDPNTSAKILAKLAKLAKDEDRDVRWYVAKHPNCPPKVLVILAKDKYWNVRWYVAKHPNCPLEVLAFLAKDKDRNVRWWITKHPNCPFKVALSLLNLGCIGYRKRKGF